MTDWWIFASEIVWCTLDNGKHICTVHVCSRYSFSPPLRLQKQPVSATASCPCVRKQSWCHEECTCAEGKKWRRLKMGNCSRTAECVIIHTNIWLITLQLLNMVLCRSCQSWKKVISSQVTRLYCNYNHWFVPSISSVHIFFIITFFSHCLTWQCWSASSNTSVVLPIRPTPMLSRIILLLRCRTTEDKCWGFISLMNLPKLAVTVSSGSGHFETGLGEKEWGTRRRRTVLSSSCVSCTFNCRLVQSSDSPHWSNGLLQDRKYRELNQLKNYTVNLVNH